MRLHPQAPQGLLGHLPDTFGTAVGAAAGLRLSIRVGLKAEFRGDHHLTLERLQRLPHQLFIRPRAIYLCRVEKGHATLHGLTQKLNHLSGVADGRVAVTHPHATQTQCGNL